MASEGSRKGRGGSHLGGTAARTSRRGFCSIALLHCNFTKQSHLARWQARLRRNGLSGSNLRPGFFAGPSATSSTKKCARGLLAGASLPDSSASNCRPRSSAERAAFPHWRPASRPRSRFWTLTSLSSRKSANRSAAERRVVDCPLQEPRATARGSPGPCSSPHRT